jgi:succinate dehydrogenase / fumarate reductase flavoprotein subunit
MAGRGTPHGGVWLDVSHLPAEQIAARLPRMLEQFRAVGVDITRQPMEVAPTAHYSMGGVRVEPTTHATSVPGLFAAGEVAAGVHGANRLGGNSLAEIIVFGRIVGQQAAIEAARPAPPLPDETVARCREAAAYWSTRDGSTLRSLLAELQNVMWEGCGVIRDESSLETALYQLEGIRSLADAAPAGAPDLAAALDLESMLLTAEATVRSALARTESRGAHQRADYPATDPAWRKTVTVAPVSAGDRLGMALATAPLADPGPEVAALLDETEYELAGRLVE